MSWDSNPDLTEPAETDEKPLFGVTGGQRAAKGDTYTVTFHGDGEEVETSNGIRAAFDATLEEASFRPVDGDGEAIPDGTEIRFMTGSTRFLSQLAELQPVNNKTVLVKVDGTGYDAGYTLETV